MRTIIWWLYLFVLCCTSPWLFLRFFACFEQFCYLSIFHYSYQIVWCKKGIKWSVKNDNSKLMNTAKITSDKYRLRYIFLFLFCSTMSSTVFWWHTLELISMVPAQLEWKIVFWNMLVKCLISLSRLSYNKSFKWEFTQVNRFNMIGF